jgi:mannose-6-phosphate isomerase-like protein (cupin superfamily)
MIRRTSNGYMWEGVDVLPYKEDGNVFKSVTRQTLFKGEGNLPVEFRYFEVGVGGHSTLERHEHQHIVMIIRGSGQVFVGDTVSEIALHDVVHVPPLTWHQFRATHGEELGFLCVVSCERDRPQRPDEDALRDLRAKPEVAEFIRV